MIHIELSETFSTFTAGLEEKVALTNKALDRTMRKIDRWLSRQIIRQMAQHTQFKQKVLKPRFFSRYSRDIKTLSIWIGVVPIDVHHAAPPIRPTQTGIKVGQLPEIESGFAGYDKQRHSRKVWKRVGKSRLPIEKQTVDIDVPTQQILERLKNRTESRFKTILAQELNYLLSK